MAGGKGTRIASIARDIPKPMIKIDNKPILEYELRCLKEQGFDDIIITIGHLGGVIQEYFGDGSSLGINITYYKEEKLLGNAGALYEMPNLLKEDFFLINGDCVFDVDLMRMLDFHKKKKALATILVHPNDHPYDSGIIVTDNEAQVLKWLAKEDDRPAYYYNQVNAGVHIISPKLLKMRPDAEKVDLDRHILKTLCGSGKMYAYKSSEYVKDMGTPERLIQVTDDLRTGRVALRNLRQKQRAFFLDRDGTINKYVGFLTDIEDFELIPGVADEIRKINQSGYLAIVVTNQPVVARGDVTKEQLEEIHKKMETLLGREGAYVDAIYYCPHHPDKGYNGEIPELKIECDCRKPKPGMLIQAANDYNIDLSESWMIGDSDSDMLAGEAAGCKCKKVEQNVCWEWASKEC